MLDLVFLARTLNHSGNLQLQITDTPGMMQAYGDAVRLLRFAGKSDEALDIQKAGAISTTLPNYILNAPMSHNTTRKAAKSQAGHLQTLLYSTSS